jgi:DNA-binding response OmpR family regulator
MPNILIVDDEPLISAMLEDWLVELGFDVVGPAHCVDDALALIAEHAASLDGAILDVTLRDGTSYPVADELRQRGVPFAFATGHAHGKQPPRFGDALTLFKPFVFEDIQATVAQILGSSRSSRDA